MPCRRAAVGRRGGMAVVAGLQTPGLGGRRDGNTTACSVGDATWMRPRPVRQGPTPRVGDGPVRRCDGNGQAHHDDLHDETLAAHGPAVLQFLVVIVTMAAELPVLMASGVMSWRWERTLCSPLTRDPPRARWAWRSRVTRMKKSRKRRRGRVQPRHLAAVVASALVLVQEGVGCLAVAAALDGSSFPPGFEDSGLVREGRLRLSCHHTSGSRFAPDAGRPSGHRHRGGKAPTKWFSQHPSRVRLRAFGYGRSGYLSSAAAGGTERLWRYISSQRGSGGGASSWAWSWSAVVNWKH